MKIIPSVRNLNLFSALSLWENNILVNGFEGLLKFIVEVNKIMVLPTGFHNLQKLLPWEYLFKKEEMNYGKLGSF